VRIKIMPIILTVLMFKASSVLGGDFDLCRFPNQTIPDNALVYAARIYRGAQTNQESARGEGRVGLIRLAVNSPERPLVLILGAYESTVWHIGWTEGTKILAVAASGHLPQTVTGLPKGTPVLTSPFPGEKYICPYFTDAFDQEKSQNLDEFSQLVTGRVPDTRFGQAESGRILMGPLIPADQPVYTAQKLNPADFDLNWPLKSFLVSAVRREQIKPATAFEYIQWVEAKNASAGQEVKTITIPHHLTSETTWSPVWAYLVLDPSFPRALAETWPELRGVDRRFFTFFLPADMDAPPPIIGVKYLLLKDGTCLGTGCGEK